MPDSPTHLNLRLSPQEYAQLEAIMGIVGESTRTATLRYLIHWHYDRYARPSDWDSLRAKAAMILTRQLRAVLGNPDANPVRPHEIERIQETGNRVLVWLTFDGSPRGISRQDWESCV